MKTRAAEQPRYSITIEHGIPIPNHRQFMPQVREALAAMKIGDSFTVANANQFSNVRGAATMMGLAVTGQAIVGTKGFRIWRTK